MLCLPASPHRHSADQSCVEGKRKGSARIDALRGTTQGRACSEQTPSQRWLGKRKTVSNLLARFGQAKGLAQEMIRGPESQEWARAAHRRRLMKAQGEIEAGQAESALTTLKSVQKQQDEEFAKRTGSAESAAGRGAVQNEYLLRAKALDAGGKRQEKQSSDAEQYTPCPDGCSSGGR